MNRETRELRWNAIANTSEGKYEWIFLIINDNRETERIVQKIYEELHPIENTLVRTEGAINGTGLRYKLISLDSHGKCPPYTDWNKIFKGKRIKDRELYERKSEDGLVMFVDEQMRAVSKSP